MTQFNSDLLNQTVLYQLQLSKQFLFDLATDISDLPKSQLVAYRSMLLDKINDCDRTLVEFVSKLPRDDRAVSANKEEQVIPIQSQVDVLNEMLGNAALSNPHSSQANVSHSFQGGMIESNTPAQAVPQNKKRGVNKYPANPGVVSNRTQADNVVWADGFDPNYHYRQ